MQVRPILVLLRSALTSRCVHHKLSNVGMERTSHVACHVHLENIWYTSTGLSLRTPTKAPLDPCVSTKAAGLVHTRNMQSAVGHKHCKAAQQSRSCSQGQAVTKVVSMQGKMGSKSSPKLSHDCKAVTLNSCGMQGNCNDLSGTQCQPQSRAAVGTAMACRQHDAAHCRRFKRAD